MLMASAILQAGAGTAVCDYRGKCCDCLYTNLLAWKDVKQLMGG
jgi:hypothetical protein